MKEISRAVARARVEACAAAALVVLCVLFGACAPPSPPLPAEPGDEDRHHPLGGDICTEDAWCWVAPRPTGSWLNAIVPVPRGRRVAVGRADTRLLSEDGGISWAGSGGYGDEDLTDAWSTKGGTVWAVGKRGRIARRSKGGAWTEVLSPTKMDLVAIHGTRADDVWAAAEYNHILHYDGHAWKVVDVAAALGFKGFWRFSDVWSSPSGEVWLVGQSVILHYDGASWRTVGFWGTETHSMQSFSAVWGAPGGAIYVTSRSGQSRKEGLWQLGKDGIVHPVEEVRTYLLRDVHGTADDDIWAVGEDDILHFDGAGWNVVFRGWANRVAPEGIVRPKILRASAIGRGEAWFMGPRGTLLRFDGRAWHDHSGHSDPAAIDTKGGYYAAASLEKPAGTSCDDYWLFGLGGAARFQAEHPEQPWSFEPDESPYGTLDATVVDGTIVRLDSHYTELEVRAFDGDAWQSLGVLTVPGVLGGSIWGAALDDLWVTSRSGSVGRLHHFDGHAWSVVDLPVESGLCAPTGPCPNAPRPEIVRGTSQDNVWVLSSTTAHKATLFRFDGLGWTATALAGDDAPRHVMSMLVEDEERGWLGELGRVYEIAGDALTVHDFDGGQAIFALARTPDGVLHAAGGSETQVVYPSGWIERELAYGFMARYDGASWVEEASGMPTAIGGLFACPDRPTLLAIGADGVVAQEAAP